MLLFFGAFVAGILTVLAPCILALLPIIVGGSVSGDAKDRKRPVIIAVSLGISLIFFTLLLKATSLLIDIPPQSIAYVSGGIIILLGIFTLFPSAYSKLSIKIGLESKAQKALGRGFQNKNQYIGPILTGAALGPVFSSCSPVYAYILATILPGSFSQAIALIIVYVIGLTLVLLLIGYYGQGFVAKVKFAANPRGWFQRTIAILFIITGLLIVSGLDKKFQVYVSQHTPFNFNQLSLNLLPDSNKNIDESKLFNVEAYDAPEFKNLGPWINSEPLTIEGLKGKVVMLDFWTYSCINCIRNNPYLEKWYQTYKDYGFTVVGAHAPEFAFEKNIENVRKAVNDQKLSYPTGLDNNFDTWNTYENQAWPTSYMIDATGKVRRIHEGEGKYKETEEAIRQLLIENGANLNMVEPVTDIDTPPVTEQQTPETYLGYSRASNYVGKPALSGTPAIRTFELNPALESNRWSLGGMWETTTEKIIARGNSTMTFKVSAKDVYLVAGSATPMSIGLQLNGQPISATGKAGSDVKDSKVVVNQAKLYRLVDFKKLTKDQVLTLTVPDGVELNVYTFGS